MLRRRRQEERTGTPADLLVVGLGNPGDKYEGTRHNVGVEVIELLCERHSGRLRPGKELALVDEVRVGQLRMALAFPTTFMNNSGQSVIKLLRRYGIEDMDRLLVVHDEMDLEVGRLKLKLGGGLAGHNGLKSIRDHAKSVEFGRLRMGVGRPPGSQSNIDHVLRRPGKADRLELDVVVVEAADAVESVLQNGYEETMGRVNQKPDSSS